MQHGSVVISALQFENNELSYEQLIATSRLVIILINLPDGQPQPSEKIGK